MWLLMLLEREKPVARTTIQTAAAPVLQARPQGERHPAAAEVRQASLVAQGRGVHHREREGSRMKLATIILPVADNKGDDLFFQHEQLKRGLLSRWGGYTVTQGHGSWLSPRNEIVSEPVRIYHVAMERADVIALRTLAASVAHYARQFSVMIVTPCGDVEFVKPAEKERAHG
jgi:hypothetical protein